MIPHEIFIDTGFWFAYLVRKDGHHRSSTGLMEELMEEGTLLSCSDLVIAETYTLLMRKVGVAASLEFLDLVQLQAEKGFTRLYFSDWPLMIQSRRLLKKYADQQISFTDAASAALMIEHRIPAIASFNRHFGIMGFTTLPA